MTYAELRTLDQSAAPIVDGRVAVLISAGDRRVYYGWASADEELATEATLTGCRCAIKWGTTHGVAELASTGPGETAKIGAPCTAVIRDVRVVRVATTGAVEQWQR